MSAEPEGVQDLLEQDANMWEGDEEDNMEGGQDEPKLANGKPVKHLPVAGPRKGSGQGAGNGHTGGAQRQQPLRQHSGNGVANTGHQQQQRYGRQPHRYFILKSKSLFNVDQSVERGIWATQVC